MIQVWKCDFCSHTDLIPKKITEHEKDCSFNKANKKCHTCKFSYEEGWDYHIPGCEINLDTFKGEEQGNCKGWIDENLDQERDNKLNKLLNL
jgi:hypothetical protein